MYFIVVIKKEKILVEWKKRFDDFTIRLVKTTVQAACLLWLLWRNYRTKSVLFGYVDRLGLKLYRRYSKLLLLLVVHLSRQSRRTLVQCITAVSLPPASLPPASLPIASLPLASNPLLCLLTDHLAMQVIPDIWLSLLQPDHRPSLLDSIWYLVTRSSLPSHTQAISSGWCTCQSGLVCLRHHWWD